MRRQVLLVRDHYETVMRLHADARPSAGKVSAMDRIGGRSTKVGQPTEQEALQGLVLTDYQRRMLDWYDCVQAVYSSLLGPQRNMRKVQQYKKFAHLIEMYVFQRRTFQFCAEHLTGGGGYKQQYISALWDEVIALIEAEAVKRMLV